MPAIDTNRTGDVPVDPDAALLASVGAGGPDAQEAFEQLLRRHQAWVNRLCLRRLAHPQDAQDAAQDALLKAMLGLPRFQGRSTFRTWLAAIVERECVDTARRRARHAMTSELAAQIETFQRQHLPQRVPAEARGRSLREVVATLPAPSRDVVELRFYQDRAMHELAAILGIGLSAAKMRLYRSVEQLRAAVPTNAARAAA